jgi:hypothetical protein
MRMPTYVVTLACVALTSATSSAEERWIGSVPAVRVACASGRNTPAAAAAVEFTALFVSNVEREGLKTIGYPFVTRADEAKGTEGAVDWEVCAPVPTEATLGAGFTTSTTAGSPAIFLVCPMTERDAAQICAERLRTWLAPAPSNVAQAGLRSMPVFASDPTDIAQLRIEVERRATAATTLPLVSTNLTTRLSAPQDGLQRQLAGLNNTKPRELLQKAPGITPVAGGAVAQRGVVIWMPITEEQRKSLAEQEKGTERP